MTLRTTRTYATLGVTPAAYTEIAQKLMAAGYEHAFHGDGENIVIDMNGIAIMAEGESSGAAGEVVRLKAEVESLRALVLAAHIAQGPGVFVVWIPGSVPVRVRDILFQTWMDAWTPHGKVPPLFVVPQGTDIQELSHDGNGVFTVRVPDGQVSVQAFERFVKAWNSVWKQTKFGSAPVCLIPGSSAIELLSDAHLQAHGLMRIPSELNAAG